VQAPSASTTSYYIDDTAVLLIRRASPPGQVSRRGGGRGEAPLRCKACRSAGSPPSPLPLPPSPQGLWCFPGGRLEWGESIAAGAAREATEETGLVVTVDGVDAASGDDVPGYAGTDAIYYGAPSAEGNAAHVAGEAGL